MRPHDAIRTDDLTIGRLLEAAVLPPGAAILTTSSAMIPTNYPSVLLMGEAEPILETVSWN
jgi:hypothetical protein